MIQRNKKSPIKKTKKKGKVNNATPNTHDGIRFLSKLETYTYKKLKEAGIPAEYEPKSFTLLPKFQYNGENIRPMTYKPDFVGKDFIIECKGIMGDAFPLRWKLFKYILMQENSNYKLYLVRNQKQVDETINLIKCQSQN